MDGIFDRRDCVSRITHAFQSKINFMQNYTMARLLIVSALQNASIQSLTLENTQCGALKSFSSIRSKRKTAVHEFVFEIDFQTVRNGDRFPLLMCTNYLFLASMDRL